MYPASRSSALTSRARPPQIKVDASPASPSSPATRLPPAEHFKDIMACTMHLLSQANPQDAIEGFFSFCDFPEFFTAISELICTDHHERFLVAPPPADLPQVKECATAHLDMLKTAMRMLRLGLLDPDFLKSDAARTRLYETLEANENARVRLDHWKGAAQPAARRAHYFRKHEPDARICVQGFVEAIVPHYLFALQQLCHLNTRFCARDLDSAQMHTLHKSLEKCLYLWIHTTFESATARFNRFLKACDQGSSAPVTIVCCIEVNAAFKAYYETLETMQR